MIKNMEPEKYSAKRNGLLFHNSGVERKITGKDIISKMQFNKNTPEAIF